MNKNKLKIIYVLSNGRSGSTLLDLLLGMHSQVWTMGEAQILPWDVKENRLPCGCGSPVIECDFWQPVLGDIPLGQGKYSIEYFRERHTGGKAVRIIHILDMLLFKMPSRGRRLAAEEYAVVNDTYFRVVKKRAEDYCNKKIEWLVDSSKDIYRLFWLSASQKFEIKVIFLTKDPRGFVFSMTKANINNHQKLIRFSLRWLVENSLFLFLCKTPLLVQNYLHIRYEDLTSSPAQSMTKISDFLGINYDNVNLDNFREYVNHAVAGNPMRQESENKISLDEKWRKNLPSASQSITWIIDGILANALGYSK